MFKTKFKPFAVAAMFAVGLSAGVSHVLANENGIVMKQAADSDQSYCHIKYMAFTDQSLRSGNLEFNPSDIVDMYGPCNFDPHSQDEVRKQQALSQRGQHNSGGDSSSND